MKICFLSTDWAENEYRRVHKQFGGVSYYRLIKPMKLLKDKYRCEFIAGGLADQSKGKSLDQFYSDFCSSYDMIIVKNIDNAVASQALIHWCRHHGTKLVQDFDDNILVIREDQPAYKNGYGAAGQKRAYAAAMMSLADALIVSTEPLKEYFKKFLKEMFNENKEIYVYPNYNDVKDWSFPQSVKDPDKIVIGWSGSITHDADLLLIMPALDKILQKYDNVHIELLGGILQGKLAYLTQGWSKKAKDKLTVKYGTPAWDKYPKLMMDQKWDIGIAPLVDEVFNHSKSHIKWMEYAMCGIPTIASDVYPYTHAIKQGETGILVKPKDWEAALSNLIENPEQRVILAHNAYKFIETNLQWKQHKDEYADIIEDVFKRVV